MKRKPFGGRVDPKPERCMDSYPLQLRAHRPLRWSLANLEPVLCTHGVEWVDCALCSKVAK